MPSNVRIPVIKLPTRNGSGRKVVKKKPREGAQHSCPVCQPLIASPCFDAYLRTPPKG